MVACVFGVSLFFFKRKEKFVILGLVPVTKEVKLRGEKDARKKV